MFTLTLEQALTANRFYSVQPDRRTKTKTAYRVIEVRRTGQTKTWKTRPDHFRVPVKYGLKESFYLTHVSEGWTTDESAAQAVCDQRNEDASMDDAERRAHARSERAIESSEEY